MCRSLTPPAWFFFFAFLTSTSRDLLRLAVAWQLPGPSPSGTPPLQPGRLEPLAERGQVRRQNPVMIVSHGLDLMQGTLATTYKRLIAHKLSCKPQERFLEVVVGLGGDVVVLKILLAVEGDGLGLDFPLLHVDLVATEDDRDVLTHPDQITMPIWYVLVCDPRCDVEHDDATVAVDVVPIAQTTKLLLSCRIPHVELDGAKILQSLSAVAFYITTAQM